MAGKLPDYVTNIATMIEAQLDPSDPGFKGSDEVRKALETGELRIYVESWILPHLRELATGHVPDWLRETARQEKVQIVIARKRARAEASGET